MTDNPAWLFAFRLALELGVLDPWRMLAEMPSQLLTDWMAFYSVDPFGEQRADLRAGIVAATTANCWRGKSGRMLKPIDFMPFYEPPEQSSDEMRDILEQVLGAVSG